MKFRDRGLCFLLFCIFFCSPLFAADPFTVWSPDLQNSEQFPSRHTCNDKNESPSIKWSGAPAGTQSFALFLTDLDAPRGKFVHWVLFDLPPTIDYLPGTLPLIRTLANSEKQGINDFGKTGYGGPCPPSGKHRYVFTLYALDKGILGLGADAKSDAVLQAMEGHIIGKTEFVKTYQSS